MDQQLYRQMMNCGFLIFEANSKFVLLKVPTPADPRETIPTSVAKTAHAEYTSFDDALMAVKSMIGYHSTPIVNADPITVQSKWLIQMMYRKRGCPPNRFEELGEIDNMPYQQAMAEAHAMAENYIEEEGLRDFIEYHEVKIKPCYRNPK